MKVKIVRCYNVDAWYGDKIGKIIEVCDEDVFSSYYLVNRGTNTGAVIYKSDCEIISEEVEQKSNAIKVKITKCDNSNSICWYKNRIGKIYNVKQDPDEEEYWIVLDDIRCFEDTKTYYIKKDDSVIVFDNIIEAPIESYPIEDLMKWRNVASARVDKIDSDLVYLANIIKETFQKIWKLKKKRKHDVKWIVKLNKILDHKVFKDRSI